MDIKWTKWFLLINCIALSFPVLHSQSQFDLSGNLVNEEEEPLEWASVVLFNPSDSTMMAFGYSDEEGFFKIPKLNRGDYLMKVGYVGLRDHEELIEVEGNVDLGTVVLYPADAIEGVDVTATRIPILVNRDTVIYDAKAYNLAQNATVEDLLKRLPGVEVDPDGNIRALGEDVQNVLVDGRRFFGGDARIATRNIQADAVNRVEVYDKKSEESEFTGIDDGTREKTINLELKEDKKGGAFGYVSGAYGTDDRYEGKLSLNSFNDKRQVAVLAGGNNINELGFSFQDYFQFTGGMQQMMSGGGGRGGGFNFGRDNPLISRGPQSGFLTSFSGGLQFTQRYGEDNEINTSYFFGLTDRSNERLLNRDNFLPGDEVLNTSEEAINDSKDYNHRLNLRWEQNMGSRTALKFNSNLNYTTRDESRVSFTENFNSSNKVNNISDQDFSADGENIDFNGSMTLRHRFEKRGRVMAAGFNGSYAKNDQEGFLNAFNRLFADGQPISEEELLESQDQENKNLNFGTDLQFTEPIGENHFLTTQYLFSKSNMRNNREVLDLSDEGDPVIIPALSNQYDADYLYHRIGISLRRVKDKSNLNGGLDYQYSTLEGVVVGNDEAVKQDFSNFLPRLSWNYEFHRGKNLNVNYNTSVREPTVIQLQPIIDNSDPLNLYEGNPDLKPSYTHRLNFRYTTFNMMTFRNFFVFGNVSYSRNRIRESIRFDDQNRRIRKPENVSDDWSLTGSVNYGTPIASTGIRTNARLSTTYNWGNAFVNEVESETRTFSPSIDFRISYDIENWLDVNLGTTISHSNTRYKIMESLNQSYQSYAHRLDLRSNFGGEKWQLESGITITQYRSDDGLFDDDIPIWNASFSRFFMEDNRIQLKIRAHDLLDQNIGFSRTADINYIQEERVLSLGRYFMLEFRYNINAAANPAAGRGGIFRTMGRLMG